MNDFKHYVFTRFNLLDDFDGLKTVYNNPDIPDPDGWMEHRMELFENFCLPSLKAQTCQNLTWLLSFAKETPQKYIRKCEEYDRVQVIYDYPRTWVRKNYTEGWLITSRIDNDDYYEPTFIEQIQNQPNIYPPEIVDIDYRQLNIATGRFYTSCRATPNSPFLSLWEYIEPGQEAKTCYYCSHTNMPNHFRARKIPEPLATMVIHDRNVINKIVGNEI